MLINKKPIYDILELLGYKAYKALLFVIAEGRNSHIEQYFNILNN